MRTALLTRNREVAVDYDVIHIAAHGASQPFPAHMQSAIEFGSVRITGHDWLLRGARVYLVFVNMLQPRPAGRARR